MKKRVKREEHKDCIRLLLYIPMYHNKRILEILEHWLTGGH